MTERFSVNRRQILGTGVAAVSLVSPMPAFAQMPARVVVVGGGFGGATFARFLKRLSPGTDVTLVEPSSTFLACPFSNLILAGLRDLKDQAFGYDTLAAEGIMVVADAAVDVDADKQTVTLSGGDVLPYDRLMMSPGVDIKFGALEGYDPAAAEIMPHAWKAGPQTTLLKNQLQAMDDGGVVVISAPANPYRCPPGPYERASLIAHYLKTTKPKSKLIILDAKDNFSKQGLFEQGWQALYGDMIEWVGLSDGGQVISVDPTTNSLTTDFDTVKADVANVIPPQQAAGIAQKAGVAIASGWCPIDPVSFESTLQKEYPCIGGRLHRQCHAEIRLFGKCPSEGVCGPSGAFAGR